MKKLILIIAISLITIFGITFITTIETTVIDSNISINEISDIKPFANKIILNDNIEATTNNNIISDIAAHSINNKEFNKSYKLIKKSNVLYVKYIITQ